MKHIKYVREARQLMNGRRWKSKPTGKVKTLPECWRVNVNWYLKRKQTVNQLANQHLANEHT